MKIIVFSDSHGSFYNMKKVIDKTLPMTDMYIHCGDGVDEFNDLREKYPERGFIGVRGNTDWYSYTEVFDAIITVDKYRVLITHGHKYGDLFSIAKARECNIVLSGHTHVRSERYIDGIHLFNPGSIERPRDGKPPSYGVMEVRNGILFSHGEV